ncbi:hypothetical protein YC2023_120298 [Brassica napus]
MGDLLDLVFDPSQRSHFDSCGLYGPILRLSGLFLICLIVMRNEVERYSRKDSKGNIFLSRTVRNWTQVCIYVNEYQLDCSVLLSDTIANQSGQIVVAACGFMVHVLVRS